MKEVVLFFYDLFSAFEEFIEQIYPMMSETIENIE